MTLRTLHAAATLAGLLALAACGSGASAGARPDSSGGAGGGRTPVVVLAAASLTDSFQQIERDYERAHPDVDVQISYAASSTIVQQVNNGAPADVIALAGESAATPLKAELAARGGRAVIASNTLEIAVPPANRARVSALADLARPGLNVVLCAATVPCGRAADRALLAAGVTASVVSREIDVRATLTKVRLGEADAAIVYHSDVVAAKGSVAGIPIPAEVNETLRYPLIWLDRRGATTAFATYVAGDGRKALAENGFGMP